MLILGIETSCDETAASVVENGTKILSDVVASSAEMHKKSGGIIPEMAARQQVRSIIPVIAESIKGIKSNKSIKSSVEKIDAIAVTAGGPGLIGSMIVGVETAKTLAYIWKKPIVPVVHLLAHLYANWLTGSPPPSFPAIVLTVAGGHSDLLLMNGHSRFKSIGGTRDDAAGEAFDKCARLLGLPYPGGPAISNEAEKYFSQSLITNHQSLNLFPRPLIDEENFDLSFSGLKTAVLRETEKLKNPTTLKLRGASKKTEELSPQQISHLAAEIQEAIVEVLVEKTLKAAKLYKPESLLVAGGVAANKRLREKFEHEITKRKMKISFHVPPPDLCTDNATFVASCAFFNYKPLPWKKITAIPDPLDAIKKYADN